MVKVIAGRKGSGKTKQMIDLVNTAMREESGSVACIERGRELTYNIHHKIRLVEASHYDMKDYVFFRGFISGMYACNYDLSHVFIDSLSKVIPCDAAGAETTEFLDWLEQFGKQNDVKFTVMLTADESLLPEGTLKYCEARS